MNSVFTLAWIVREGFVREGFRPRYSHLQRSQRCSKSLKNTWTHLLFQGLKLPFFWDLFQGHLPCWVMGLEVMSN